MEGGSEMRERERTGGREPLRSPSRTMTQSRHHALTLFAASVFLMVVVLPTAFTLV